MLTKDELRRQIRHFKKSYTANQLRLLSDPILHRLEQYGEFRKSTTIMAYFSLPDEVFTHDFLKKWAACKRFLLPVVEGEDILLKEYDPREKMITGALNVMEPVSDNYFTDYAAIDMVMVPGVAFDTQGNRMGRGKGFYDRFLIKIPQAARIGICFPFQFVETVPHQEWDIRMQHVIH